MKNKREVAIIGGGITGCVAALYAAKKGHKVILLEKSNSLGGILRDAKNKNNIYFNACQYLSSNETWYKSLIKNNFDIDNFSHDKATYTKIFDEENFEKDIAGPVINQKLELEIKKNFKKNNKSLLDRLQLYPNSISINLKRWLENIGLKAENLSWDSGNGLAIGRIFPRKNLDLIKKNKKKSKLYDELVGLSRNEINYSDLHAALPKYGYNYFFSEFYKKLIESDVIVHLSTPVKTIWKSSQVNIRYNNKEILPHKVIWTGNPTGLVKSFGLPLLESQHVKAKHFFYEFKGNLKNNIYIQNYSFSNLILRIFFYKLNKRNKITIETLSDKISSSDINKSLKFFIKKLNYNFDLKSNEFTEIQKKYIIISKKDNKILKTFIDRTKKTNLIHGNWLEYGRDNKINYVLKKIDEIK